MRAIASVAVFLAAWCTQVLARDIVVVQVVDYTGKYAEASRDFVGGAKTYFDLINSRGGVNGFGHRIRYKAVDGGPSADLQRAKLREVLDEGADVLFGFVGDDSVEVAAAEAELRQGQIALVGPLAGRASPSPSVFFVRPTYDAEVRQIISFFRTFKVTRFAVVKAANEYGRSVGGSLEKELAAQQLSLASSITLQAAAGVDGRDLEALARARPQALVLVTDTVAAAEFVKRYKPRDPGVMTVGLSIMNHQVMFEILGPELANGVMITQVVPNPTIGDSALTREYLAAMRKFRDEPPSHVSFEGFIAAKALVEGLKGAGAVPDRRAILQAMRKLRRVDLSGYVVDVTQSGRDSLSVVDLTMIRRDGTLLR